MATSSKDFPIDSGAAAPPAGGGYACGWAHAQGRRSSMEDEVILGTPLPTQADGAGDGGLQLWAVMDGHAGRRAVELLVTLLPEAFARATRQALTTSSSSSDTAPLLSPDDITHVLQTVDEQLLAASDAEGGWSDGATALLAITATSEHRRRPMQLIQLGDSQAVLCGAFGADALCPQHRVGEPAEDARLEALGTTVEDGRVVGGGAAVAVTRSLGDALVKRGSAGGLIAVPAVSEHRLSAADELLLLGCDGLWDVMGAEDAYDIARKAGRGRDGRGTSRRPQRHSSRRHLIGGRVTMSLWSPLA